MPIAQRAITEIQEADDFLGTPSDGQVLVWSVAANAFVPASLSGSNSILGSESVPVYDAGVLKLKGSTHNDDRLEFGIDDTLGNGNWLQSFRRAVPNLLKLQPLGGGLTSKGLGTGVNNEVWGDGAAISLTTGSYNSVLGFQAGQSITVGSGNVFLGTQSGFYNTSGSNNVGIGVQALVGSTGLLTGNYNLAIGASAGQNLSSGSSNVCIGALSGQGSVSALTMHDNVFVGYASGNAVSSGFNNVFLGSQAGLTLTTGFNNIVIGQGADVKALDTTYAIVIGQGAKAASSSVSIGSGANVVGTAALSIGNNLSNGTDSSVLLGSASSLSGGAIVGVGSFVSVSGAVAIGIGQNLAPLHLSTLILGAAAGPAMASENPGEHIHVTLFADPSLYLARDTSTNNRKIGGLQGSWAVSTDAARLGRIVLGVNDYLGFKSALQIDTDGTDVFLNALGSLKNKLPVNPNTSGVSSPNVILALQSGTVFTNEGSSALNYHNLPSAVRNLHYTFVIRESVGIRVNAQPGQTIRVGSTVSSTGGFIQSTAIGSTLHLIAINATEWYTEGMQGTWSLS